jgi:1-acyl-sn-glycerol-3-phosphate acyltransferase
VLLFLPHAIRIRKHEHEKKHEPILITKLAGLSLENNRWTVGTIIILTIIFGYFSLQTEFDSDMRNINFMTSEQWADMEYFQSLLTNTSNTESVYVVSNGHTWDDALTQNEIISARIDSLVTAGAATRHNNVSAFLVSKTEQQHRLANWQAFIEKYRDAIGQGLTSSAVAHGFNPEAFTALNDILNQAYSLQEFDHFEDLISSVFVGNISEDRSTGRKSVVQTLEVKSADVEAVKAALSGQQGFDGLCFDVKSMNGSIANTLSNDFNYIGIACGCIVFVFLWISLGSIELAMVSFLPMAVSWIWILGIMAILGIKFNIVNVILATFIFGQGDDYTIFMTEGLSYEFAYRKKLLASYKNSIIVSALIMFIGIGTLIFAKHPALRSLGEVTVVGMLSVVMMAYLFPPLVFNWLVSQNGKVRQRPLTLKKILCTAYCAMVFFAQLSVAYVMGFFMLILTKPTPRKKLILHKYCCSVFRFDVKRMPGTSFKYDNSINEDFRKPAVIISNHQSLLDSFYLMFLSPKIIMVANDHVSVNPVTGRIFRWLDFITVGQGADLMLEKVKPYVEQGYSIVIFPEGERPRYVSNNVKRFHKGAFQFAEELGLDILPVYLHGIVQAMPKGSAVTNGGEVFIKIGRRITPAELQALGTTTKERAQAVKKQYQDSFDEICRQQSTVALLKDTVYDRYRYKGAEIERNAKKMLRYLLSVREQIEGLNNGQDFFVINKKGQGELTLMLSLMYPKQTIYSITDAEDAQRILEGAVLDFVHNVKFIASAELSAYDTSSANRFTVSANQDGDIEIVSC